MKLGIISDIHNNLIALEKVLDCLQKEKCDKIICCGDIIGIGPYPEETVQLMMKTENLIAVRGNHERYLSEGIDSNSEEMDENEKNHHLWDMAYYLKCIDAGKKAGINPPEHESVTFTNFIR